MSEKYYVYEWFIVETKEVFYVGKGCDNRVTSMKNRNDYFKNIRNKYVCDYRILKRFSNEQDAYDYEKERGLELKKIGQAKACFVLGGKQKYISKETIEKMKKTQFKKGQKPHNYGKKLSQDQIENLRRKHLGKKASEETKKKMSDSQKGHDVSQKTIDKLLERVCKSVSLIEIETNKTIKTYNSMADMSRDFNVSLATISIKCKNKTIFKNKYYIIKN